MRNEGEEPNDVVTTAANHTRARFGTRLRPVALAAVLRCLAEKLSLQGEDVVQHAIDAPSLEPMVSDHSSLLEMVAQRCPQRPIDPRPSHHLCLFQQLEATVERELAQPVLSNCHVPSTSTLPVVVTR